MGDRMRTNALASMDADTETRPRVFGISVAEQHFPSPRPLLSALRLLSGSSSARGSTLYSARRPQTTTTAAAAEGGGGGGVPSTLPSTPGLGRCCLEE